MIRCQRPFRYWGRNVPFVSSLLINETLMIDETKAAL